jgi:two-component system OmpR family response regulator
MTEENSKILLVEDDERLGHLTKKFLEQNGLDVDIETRGDHALNTFRQIQPDLVILDLMLPGLDGISVCKLLREIYNGPILMLTAKSHDIDLIIGLESGADDYVAKPAEPMVLLARIRALLRRQQSATTEIAAQELCFGKLKMSHAAQQAWLDDRKIDLTTQEFDLLWIMASNAGNILSRSQLFKLTRGIDYNGLDRSIDVRISHLRKKVQDNLETPFRIKTIWGKGYLFIEDAWG